MDPEGYRPEVVDQAGVRTPGGAAGSRLGNGIASGLTHVLIFADTRIVAGQEADAIAVGKLQVEQNQPVGRHGSEVVGGVQRFCPVNGVSVG